MSNTQKTDPATQTIDTQQLDDVTGGCAVGGCYGGGCPIGGVAYTRSTGFGIDPLFVLFAMTLFQSINK